MYNYQTDIVMSIMIKDQLINWNEVQYIVPYDRKISIKFKGHNDNILNIEDDNPKDLINEIFKSLKQQ